jgi:Tfp pilus assembly protein PilV
MTRRANSQSGLTLIEILMTILIMMVGAAGLIALQAATMASSRFARDMTTANSLLLSKAEEFRLVNPIPTSTNQAACQTLLTCGGPGEVVNETGQPTTGGRFTRCWCSAIDGVDLVVTVLVAWNDSDQTPASCTGATHCVRGQLRRRQ